MARSKPKDITLVNLNIFLPACTPYWPSFVKRFLVRRNIPWPTGVLCLAAALEQAGFSVDVRDYQLYQKPDKFKTIAMTEFIASDSADLIFISCSSSFLPHAAITATKIKTIFPHKIIVLGGIGPSGVAAELLKAFPLIDIVAIGEGEQIAVTIAKAMRDKKPLTTIRGIAFQGKNKVIVTKPQERILDGTKIPRPAYHLIDLKRYNSGGISISRGCPYGCIFCNLVGMWRQKVVARPVDDIIEELKYLRSKRKSIVSFVDDTFIVNKNKAQAFCTRLIQEKLGVGYICQGRVDSIDGPMLQLLHRSGCREIFFGIESGSNTVLKKIKKQFTIEKAMWAIEQTINAGIRVTASFIWGFPFETKTDFLRTIQAVRKAKQLGATVALSVLTPLPLSPMYAQYKKTLTSSDQGPTFISGILGREWLLNEEIRTVVQQHPEVFPTFFLYNSPSLKDKIDLINNSLARNGLQYAATH